MSGPQDVTVQIFGQSYTLRSAAAAEDVAALAAESDRLAVLVALNLADDLARERRARQEDRETVGARARRILAILDDEVGNRGTGGV